MKLTESHLRNIIKKELKEMLDDKTMKDYHGMTSGEFASKLEGIDEMYSMVISGLSNLIPDVEGLARKAKRQAPQGIGGYYANEVSGVAIELEQLVRKLKILKNKQMEENP